MRIKQGSVVLVDFSYSNLKEAKFRPALVKEKIKEIRQKLLELIS